MTYDVSNHSVCILLPSSMRKDSQGHQVTSDPLVIVRNANMSSSALRYEVLNMYKRKSLSKPEHQPPVLTDVRRTPLPWTRVPSWL